jgi:diguanylate cyclase (GGDEF)-like protein
MDVDAATRSRQRQLVTAREHTPSRSVALDEDLEAARGRWLGYMFAFAALLSPMSLVVPHQDGYNAAGIIAVTVVAAATAVVLLLLRKRPPDAAVHAIAVLGALLTAATIHFTNGLPNAASLFYLWIVLFVFYFFVWRLALAHLAVVLILYTLNAIGTDSDYPLFGNVIATISALAGAGAIVAALRRRINSLTAALVETALTDELTGLSNRRAFTDDFRRAIARAGRTGEPLALAVADLDHFKNINDAYGHPVGDQVLSRFAALMQSSVRAGDVAARLGGEEFAVLFIGADPAAAGGFAERLRAETERTFTEDGPEITVSIGVANWRADDPVESVDLMRRADQALYEAKNAGRNRVVEWKPVASGVRQ